MIRYITATEYAALFCITSRQARNLAASGKVPAERVGTRWRFRVDLSDAQFRELRGSKQSA